MTAVIADHDAKRRHLALDEAIRTRFLCRTWLNLLISRHQRKSRTPI
jgi:hypothetical protein